MKRRILMAAACVAFAMPAFMFGPSLDAQTPPAPAFEVASVLLLAAIVSAVVLARRRDPLPEAAGQPQTAALREGSTQ